jgi:tol-pal system protein YbgF
MLTKRLCTLLVRIPPHSSPLTPHAMLTKRLCALLLVPVLGLLSTGNYVIAQEEAPVIEGLQPEDPGTALGRSERLSSHRALLDLQNQIAGLEREIKRLRGELEEQTHRLEQLGKRQRDHYLDIDHRLQTLEGGKVARKPVETLPPSSPENTGPGAATDRSETPLPAETTKPTRSAAPAKSTTTLATAAPPEHEAYQQAFDLLKSGRYDESLTAFNDFLIKYPNSNYADNAQYWLGETYYVRRQFGPAIMEYEKLIQNYPKSQKLTHALLKIGYSYHELGQIDKAKATLEDLKNRYPDTTAARLAEERLQRITFERP